MQVSSTFEYHYSTLNKQNQQHIKMIFKLYFAVVIYFWVHFGGAFTSPVLPENHACKHRIID